MKEKFYDRGKMEKQKGRKKKISGGNETFYQ